MNVTNEKFKNDFIRDFRYLQTIFERGYNELEATKIDEMTPYSVKMGFRPQNLVSRLNMHIESSKKIWRAKYISEHSEEYEELKKLNRIINLFYNSSKRHCFNDYETVLKYLKKHNYSKIEEGKVLAFFINYTIMYFKEYRYNGNEEEIRKAIEEVVETNSSSKTPKKEKKSRIEKEIADFDKNQETSYRAYFLLRSLINEAGTLQPVEYAHELIGVKALLLEEMGEEAALKVLDASCEMAKQIREKNLNEILKERNLKAVREKNEASLQASLKQQRLLTKQEKEAKVALQCYLKEDRPICFIGGNLDLVLSLLEKAGYNKIKINEIKRSILLNDDNLLKKEQKELFDKACETYLNVEQRSLLDMINTILNNPDAIQNPVFYEMQDTYLIIKNSLLKLIKEETDDSIYEKEYLGLCLEEIKQLLATYRASSYKLVLEKNSN